MKHLFGFFERPVGAAADVRELEYISALHQTSSTVRQDATISATDVRLFLRSRYGIVIDNDDALDIVKGLSGTARLPLPVVKKRRGLGLHMFRRRRSPEGTALDVESGAVGTQESIPEVSAVKSRRRCCGRPETGDERNDDEEENETSAFRAASMLKRIQIQKTDARTSWNVLSSEPKKQVAKDVDELVRYDLVQLMSMLLIPTLRRLERDRFKEPRPQPEHRAIPPTNNLWKLAKLGSRLITWPYICWQGVLHRRMVAAKDELRPKPANLIFDVLRVMLATLEDDSKQPLSRSTMLGVAASLQGESIATMRSHFPHLNHTVVTETLIKDLLEHCGEEESANDSVLIDQMVEAVGGKGTVFDERAFARALTSDVNLWPVESEDDVTTTFYDVYGFSAMESNEYANTVSPEELLHAGTRVDSPWTLTNPLQRRSQLVRQDSADSFHSAVSTYQLEVSDDQGKSWRQVSKDWKSKRLGKVPRYKPTASYIDYAADSFRSVICTVFIFLFFSAAAVFIVMLINYIGLGEVSCDASADGSLESFGCELVDTIWSWLSLAIVLCTGGLVIVVPISLGNHQFVRSYRLTLVSAISLCLFVSAPLIEIFLVDYVGINVSEDWLEERSSTQYEAVFVLYMLSGGMVGLEIFRGTVAAMLPKSLVRRLAVLRFMFLPSDIRRTSSVKRAATHKINSMIEHAHKLHRRAHRKAQGRHISDITMLTFVLKGEQKVECGGFLWTFWRTIWKHDIAKKEGVWIQSTLVIGQMSQAVILAALILLWILGTEELAKETEESRANAKENGGAFEETILLWIPEDWMIYYSFYPGGIVTWALIILLISVYYPSTVATILKFRSGFHQSLHDPAFNRYRARAGEWNICMVEIVSRAQLTTLQTHMGIASWRILDLSYYNLGNMIYALFGSAALFFLIFVGALFLLYWPISRDFMILVLAWGIGLTVTCTAKMLITGCFRSSNFKGLYRRRPAAANFTFLAMEAWHIGLGGGVMLGRLTQILLACAFWIGRIDVPFLSPDVEVFGYRFDVVANYYVSDLLIHDAHRHPFIERLSAIYLMRLKYGEHFGSDAGAAWRRIFVLVLMPWLMKYRQGKDDDDDEEGDDELVDECYPPDDGLASVMPAEKEVRFSGNVPWAANDTATNGAAT